MTLFLLSLLLLGVSGFLALACRRNERLAVLLGSGGAVLGGLLGLLPAVRAALGASTVALQATWTLPSGTLVLGLDALSGFFLVPTLLLTAVAALYGVEYLRPYQGTGKLGPAWFCFNLLALSMAVVLTAGNAVLFLVAWETMALVSFGLVVLDHEQAASRDAGWVYLVATHLGTALLLVMFVIMGETAGSYDFAAIRALGAQTVLAGGVEGLVRAPAPALPASLVFVLAVIGFGTKAGILPLHV